MTVQRYTWEDSLIEAETLGVIPSGAVNMCLRLARAINWQPKDGGPSELRWRNETALESVNSSRATYFRYRTILFDTGFLAEKNGNLIPLVPDLSQIETTESHIETDLSQIETEESQIDTPYSEDTYTVDLLSDNSLSEDAPPVSSNKEVSEGYEFLGSLNSEDFEGFSNSQESLSFDYLANSVGVAVFESLETVPESQIETEVEKSGDWLFLDRQERRFFENHDAPMHLLNEAVALYRTGVSKGYGWVERAENALERVGLASEVW